MRVKLFAFLSAAVLFGLVAVPASASSQGDSYLALGDSVPFGFNPLLDASNASNFVGYPEIVAQRLNIEDVNATCPGEATGGFLSLTGTDNVCRPYRFFFHFPLHVSYPGTQMAFATAYLSSHPRTRLVTLTLGANDFFHLQNVCAAANSDPAAAAACVNAGIPAMLATMGANLNTIFTGLRATGYTGLIVALTYYALDYSDTSGAMLLNGPMILAAAANGVRIASGLDAWAQRAHGGSSCTAKLLIELPTGLCDVHPTLLGHKKLAEEIISTIAASCAAQSPIVCLGRTET